MLGNRILTVFRRFHVAKMPSKEKRKFRSIRRKKRKFTGNRFVKVMVENEETLQAEARAADSASSIEESLGLDLGPSHNLGPS